MGYERNVVVLTQPAGYRKKPEMQFLAKTVYRKYPDFCKALLNRHDDYNRLMDFLEERQRQGRIFIIRPSEKLDIKRVENDVNKVQKAYDLGNANAKAAMAELKVWLAEGE